MFRSSFIKLLKASYVNKQFRAVQDHNKFELFKLYSPSINISLCMNITSQPSTLYKHDQDEEYFVKIKNDPDTFGAAGEKEAPVDVDDVKEQEFLEYKPSAEQKLRTPQYARIIKDLIRQKKIKEAIDILEIRMIKEDRVKPENYIFNLVLGACGRVGYTKKAFSLYNKMKQRGLVVTGGTYTALFNACANSPWQADGLSRAEHLRNIMIEKRYEPNETNYNAMIKAFGRCGDLKTAFQLVDEMSHKNIIVNEDTINFLLQACISDKEAGFRHALLVWQKFYQKKLTPNIYSFNLLLKCVSDCNLGDLEMTKDVIDKILNEPKNLNKNFIHKKMLAPGTDNCKHIDENLISNDDTAIENSLQTVKESKISDIISRPNLIAKVPHLGNIMSLTEVTKPKDRFLLVGGLSGFLQNMKENHCSPDIKTFTQMLDLIPGSFPAEKELIRAMKIANVNPDVDFYNMLIKKRSMRFEYEAAKEVVGLLKGMKLMPNIVTYGVLALGCKTKEEAIDLMGELRNARHRMNPEILGAMLRQACCQWNFPYVLEVMDTCIKEEIRPNKIFMKTLEEFKRRCKFISNDSNSQLGQTASFQKGFKVFRLQYSIWKTKVDPINEDEIHPWQQYRQTSETDVKHVKDKERGSRFKPRHTSLFKQKKDTFVDEQQNNRDQWRNTYFKKESIRHDDPDHQNNRDQWTKNNFQRESIRHDNPDNQNNRGQWRKNNFHKESIRHDDPNHQNNRGQWRKANVQKEDIRDDVLDHQKHIDAT